MATDKKIITKAHPQKKSEGFLKKYINLTDAQFITLHNMPFPGRVKTLLLILLVTICCISTRVSTMRTLDVDNDESNYTTGVGFQYAEYMKSGDFMSIVKCRENYEHPPLVKLIYGIAISISGKNKSPEEVIWICRLTSIIFACLGTILLFFISPLASIIFCVHTVQIYYSSKGWLDCITAFFTIAAFFFFIKAGKKWNKIMIASAIFLGAGIASKYVNGVFAIAIFIFLLIIFYKQPKYILYYIGVSVVSFFILDPALWVDPIANIRQSVSFHQIQSSGSALFQRYLDRYSGDTGLFGQFTTLWGNKFMYQENELMFAFDRTIFIFGFLGLPFLFRRNIILFTWFVAGALFLLFYPVKYPQYTLVFLPALSISAAELFRGIPWAISRKFKNFTPPVFINNINLAVLSAVVITIYASAFTYQHRNVKNDSLKAYNSYAYTLTQLGRTEEAKVIFEKSGQVGGELSVAARLNMANILLEQKKYAEARAELDQAFQLNPNLPVGHIILGNIFMDEGKNDEAIKEYQKVDTKQVIDPNVLVALWLNLGSVYNKKKEFDLSSRMLEKAIKISPNDGDAHFLLGLDYFMLNNILLSEKEFLLAIKNGVENWDVYHDLGVVYASQRRYKEAINAWEKALRYDPSKTETKNYIENAKRLL